MITQQYIYNKKKYNNAEITYTCKTYASLNNISIKKKGR